MTRACLTVAEREAVSLKANGWTVTAQHYTRIGVRRVTDELTRLAKYGHLTPEAVLAARDWAEDLDYDGTNLVEVPVATEPPPPPPPPIMVTIRDRDTVQERFYLDNYGVRRPECSYCHNSLANGDDGLCASCRIGLERLKLPPGTVPYGVQCDICLRPEPHRHCPSCSSTEIGPTEAACLRCSVIAARELTR